LWPTGDAANGGTVSKPAAEARYDAQLSSQLNAIVAQTVGAGKAQVRVKSDLNVDATQRDELQYAKKGTPLKVTKDTERLRGGDGHARRAARQHPRLREVGRRRPGLAAVPLLRPARAAPPRVGRPDRRAGLAAPDRVAAAGRRARRGRGRDAAAADEQPEPPPPAGRAGRPA